MTTNNLLADSRVSRLVELAILEDAGMGDLTSEAIVPADQVSGALFLCKAGGVVAGQDVVGIVFRHCDPEIVFTSSVPEGSPVRPGDTLAFVQGSTRGILMGERTALNFLQRMSGIATATRAFVDAVKGTRAKITDTRKTAPGLRVLDKLAVSIGGGVNHRFGLDDMILIKDNHKIAAGSITRAVELCRMYLDTMTQGVPIEVETTTLEEVHEAVACAGVARIMLDNFAIPDMLQAVELIGGRVEVEASGGVTLETVRAIADTGVDFISVGALTHSVRALDISLELSPHV